MQTTLAFVLFLGLVLSLVTSNKLNDAEKRLVLSYQTGTCVNRLGHCADYGQWVCSHPEYTAWAKENCAKMCNLCSSGSVSTPQMPGSGCVHSSQVYQQGQMWKDGCKYRCKCIDGTSGKYQCTQLCLTWDLPKSCRMDPPAPGKCCPKPVCPPYITLQYPPGYVEE